MDLRGSTVLFWHHIYLCSLWSNYEGITALHRHGLVDRMCMSPTDTHIFSSPFSCRLAQTPSLTVGKKVTRVHSNEFRGAQSSYRNPLSNTLCASPGSIRHNRSHRYSQPINQAPPIFPAFAASHSSPSPPHKQLPDIPPPLPSPRNRVKAVPPPLAPKTFPASSSASHGISNTLPRSHSPQIPPSVATRQLPMIPGLISSSSDPSLDIDARPPAPLPNDVRTVGKRVITAGSIFPHPLIELNTVPTL